MENIWVTIIISSATFILGYFAGIYLPLKFRKDDKKPKISVGLLQGQQNYFEITNHGGDIVNLSMEISWLQEEKIEKREIKSFFNSNEDPALMSSHMCGCIKKGETKKVSSCPMYSDNGEVNVFLKGEDIDGRKYNKVFVLKNTIPWKK